MKPVLVVAAVVAALALPAAAASPPKQEIARLKHEVTALKRQNAALVRANEESQAVFSVLRHRIGLGDPCPITTPNRSVPPGSTAGSVFHGNGKIWVGMWESNIVLQKPKADGTIDAKFGWWRGVPGQLTIKAHRLDAPAPAASSSVPSGYGDQGFQASGIIFPTEGCWQITGRVGEASLTFVTIVLKP